MSSNPLDYQSPSPSSRRAVRWPLILFFTPIIAWIVFTLLSLALSPDPVRTLRFRFRQDFYELFVMSLLGATWVLVSKINETRKQKLSYLAVASALMVLLNPLLLHGISQLLGLWFFKAEHDELNSFVIAWIPLICGNIAAFRINRHPELLCGRPLALIGVFGGSLWIIGWVLLAMIFAFGMSSF